MINHNVNLGIYHDRWFTTYKGKIYKNALTDINTAINNKSIIDNATTSPILLLNIGNLGGACDVVWNSADNCRTVAHIYHNGEIRYFDKNPRPEIILFCQQSAKKYQQNRIDRYKYKQ